MLKNTMSLDQNVWLVTEDVSGINIVPCVVLKITQDAVEAVSNNGIRFTLCNTDLDNVYSTCEAAECIVQRSGKKRSCWY